ncbi:thiamine pyrophosphate-binding protein [Alcaligenaceae bacterium CGII-47]|nr:thiamine pyrophosphate-binding protein [Alcaligenaceae bacterium CGII-47]
MTQKTLISGGRALAKMLGLASPSPCFGMGGFQLLPFYEGMRAEGLAHYLINDERCGAFAADAYARVSGKPGLCDATLGPGATNLVTALVESLNAGVPLIAITGNTHRAHSWKNMTQECHQLDILRPAVKDILRVELVQRIPELVRRAYAVATSGRPGPVVIDIPEDITHAEYAFDEADFYIDVATTHIPARRTRPAARDMDLAVTMISKARRPILLVGGGVHLSGASQALQTFAEQNEIPVAHTMSGKGAIACNHRLSAGIFGRYDRVANGLITESDCVIVVGCKLGEVATKRYALFAPNTPIIQIDSVAEEIGRTTPISLGLWGDARETLHALAEGLSQQPSRGSSEHANRVAAIEEMHARLKVWRAGAHDRYTSTEVPINMGRLIGELRKALPDDGILIADGGFAAHWTGLLFDTHSAGRTYLADRGLASIGYGLPGCMGAQLAAPDKVVVGLTGDGGLNMTIGELETARRVGANFILIVVNNAASGYVKALQHAMYGEYQSSDLVEMNYAAIAEAMGCRGIRVEDPEKLAEAYHSAMQNRDRPTVIDVVVTRDPAKMLPAADSRTLKVEKGDRPV